MYNCIIYDVGHAFSPHRYHHDSSETEKDNIECIATDGVNSVEFVLHIKVKNTFNHLFFAFIYKPAIKWYLTVRRFYSLTGNASQR